MIGNMFTVTHVINHVLLVLKGLVFGASRSWIYRCGAALPETAGSNVSLVAYGFHSSFVSALFPG
jgi:hypothetical protein